MLPKPWPADPRDRVPGSRTAAALRSALDALEVAAAARMRAQEAARRAAHVLRREHLGTTWTPEAHEPTAMRDACPTCALLAEAAEWGA